ncbi:MAG TPA: hypothetical protein VLG47_05460 [Candidatus Saccharimonadales bacterium]|nr:hypothetical protein [Candidatus Saccharimonadales bacterium]
MFAKPKIIVYIRRSNIIIAGKNISAAKLNIPPSILLNLEIVDTNSFYQSARDFFATRDIKGKKVLIALDDSVVFSKVASLENADKSDINKFANQYIDAMPFNAGQRACLQIVDNDQLELYGTNAQLYQMTMDALKDAGAGKVVAVSPTPAYKLATDLQPSAAVDRYLNDTETQKIADFLAVSPV